MLKKLISGVTASLLALSLIGCSQDDDTSFEAEERVVNVYSARHYDSDKAMYERFEAETGIRVRTRQSGASQLLETMRAEGGESPADLVIAADAGTLWQFQEDGLLQPIAADRLAGDLPALAADDASWIGLSKRLRVIVVANDVPEDAIRNYGDLADPRWEGEICVRSSRNIYNLSLLGDLIDRMGPEAAEEWAAAVKGNFARDPQGGDTDQIRAVAAGACNIAIVNHYYWHRLANSASEDDREGTSATRIIFPDQSTGGTHRNVTGIGLAASSPNTEEALELIDFLLSTEGQGLLVVETGEIPLDPQADSMAGLDDARNAATNSAPLAVYGRNQAEAREIFDRVGWD